MNGLRRQETPAAVVAAPPTDRGEKPIVLSTPGNFDTMPFVTRVTLRSGDGDRLDDVVSDIKARAERKGVELKGPHPKPPAKLAVPQYKTAERADSFDTWNYTVYRRVIEIVDHNEFAREVTERTYPDSIHVAADIEQFNQAGDD